MHRGGGNDELHGDDARHPAAATAFPVFSSDTDDTAWISDDSDARVPQFVAAHDAHASDDDDFEVPSPAVHRDSHASLVWAPAPHGADALNQWGLDRSDRKPDFSVLVSSTAAAKRQQPVLNLLPAGTAATSSSSSLSSASALTSAVPPPDDDVPLKDASVFAYADISFPSTRGHSPATVIETLTCALASLDAMDVRDVRRAWRLDVSCLCVAEHIAFSIQVARLGDDGSVGDRRSLDVAFHRRVGDEARFLALVACVRARCRAIDDDALPFVLADDDVTLAPWMDARLPITDARAALEPRDALALLALLRAELHATTRFEAAKQLKDHCRHAGNRTTLRRVDPAGFASVLTALLASDSLELSRFGVFVLLQYARDPPPPRGAAGAASLFFASPYTQRTAAMQLADVLRAHRNAACGAFTCAMVREVQRSWLFA